MDANGGKDPRYSDKSPHSADEQAQPEPERPVPDAERRAESGQPGKPSQAEGER